ncbi:hypothetical protein HK104_006280, partial [Borealophlyctis nickersoniae]
VYRTWSTFIFDQLLHLFCGALVSIATQRFAYVAAQPKEVCDIAPVSLRAFCEDPQDEIRTAAMFIILGAMFAGTSVGSSTFGRERVVYFRDTSTGMRTFPYFLAKIVIDLPRIIVGGVMYAFALILFFPHRQDFVFILLVIEFMYFAAFAMGYHLSIAFKPNHVPLVSTGVSLLWALVMSGVMPTLTDVYTSPTYTPVRWLWSVSAPRYAIEAFWIKEVGAYPFEKPVTAPYEYDWDNFDKDLKAMFLIGVGWMGVAFLGLKLFDRSKHK